MSHKVAIFKYYDYPDLLRQTPKQSGIWQDVHFEINKLSEPLDIFVVLNSLREEMTVECGEAWLIIQEPPIESFPWIFEGQKSYSQVYSPFCRTVKKNCLPSHGALPWHVDMTYDELKKLSPPYKRKLLSWITSSKTIFQGHKERMEFLNVLKASELNFDLFGHGFNSIANKYDGLGPYRYSLAIENYKGLHYWTEKVADCFLSWTMPIYYGCTNLADYFPPDSFMEIDIKDPKVSDHIADIINSDMYLRNKDSIAEARRRILDEYQLFPFIADAARNRLQKKEITIQKILPYKESSLSKVKRGLKYLCYQ